MNKQAVNRHLILLRGNIPAKKNNRQIFTKRTLTRSGVKVKVSNIPQTAYSQWHKSMGLQLLGEPRGLKPKSMRIKFWFKTNGRRDLSNALESVMDLLVDTGILKDDSWQETGPIEMIPGGVSPQNPGCIIEFNFLDRI